MTTKTKDTKKIATPKRLKFRPTTEGFRMKSAKYKVLDLIPMQRELQRLTNISVDHVVKATGAVTRGDLLTSLDYTYSRRESVNAHFQRGGLVDKNGQRVSCIAINPYDLANTTDAEREGIILHEVVHFVASFTENKILFGFKKNAKSPDGYSNDTSNQGRYHNPNFAKVAGMVPWLECFKSENPKVGYTTKLSDKGIKAVAKIVKPGIFDGLHKAIEPKTAKSAGQYVGYVCQDEECKFSSQVSGGLVKAIDNGEEYISQHCGMDMVKK